MKAKKRAWWIGGRRWANSAAQFWRDLLEGLRREHPDDVRIELSAPGSGRLSRRLLFPEAQLEEEAEAWADRDTTAELRRLYAELELLGPPAPVLLRVLNADGSERAPPQPIEGLDAEIFPYLAAWLLEWAGIDEAEWNREKLEGGFAASNSRSGPSCSVALEMRTIPLEEGLYRRVLTMHYRPATS